MQFFFHFFITPPTKSLRSFPQFSATPQLRRGGVAENCGVAETFSRTDFSTEAENYVKLF